MNQFLDGGCPQLTLSTLSTAMGNPSGIRSKALLLIRLTADMGKWLFGNQRGLTVGSSFQFGLPA